MNNTIFNEPRAKHGSVKAKIAALPVGGSINAADPLQRNKYYVTARRLGYQLVSHGTKLVRTK
jgi:hypothetical protein